MVTILVTPELIAYMYVLYHFQSPDGLAKILKNDEFWWFITAKCISLAVKIVGMSVGPTTWKKMEVHANRAKVVANFFELMAIHQVGRMVLGGSFLGRLFVNCFSIGLFVRRLLDHVLSVTKGATTELVENNAVNNHI